MKIARRPAPSGVFHTLSALTQGVFLGATSLALLLPAPAQAQNASTVVQTPVVFDIAAGPLDQALSRFGRQAGRAISVNAALTTGLRSPGVSGSFDADEALRRLLTGTGLEAVREGSGEYTLRPLPAPTDGAAMLAPVMVTGQTLATATGPVDGYVAERSATGTKTDAALLETPQSLSVVSREALDTQGTLNIANGLRYTSGVGAAAYSNGDGNSFDVFTVRGFVISNSGLLLDGMRLHYNVLDAPTEVYGLERIEVLKGPSSVLYGQTSPSGVINLISKRPSAESRHEIELTGGSYDRRQVATDHTGALNEDGSLSYRLTGLFRESDTFVDFNRDDRVFIAPALRWQPSANTSLTLLTSYQKSLGRYYMGLPYSGTVRSNPLGRPDRDTNLGDPDYNFWNTYSRAAGYIFEHRFASGLEFKQSARYSQSRLDYGYLFPAVASLDLPANPIVPRQGIRRQDRTSTLTVDTNVTARWQGLGAENTTLVGLDYGRSHSDTQNYRGAAPPTNLFDPVYDIAGVPPAMALRNSDVVRFEQVGLYAQQQSKFFDRWLLTLGGRQDWSDNDAYSRVTDKRTKQRDDAFTGRIGLSYLADNGIAPYVSYTQSFEPVGGTTYEGNPFKPTEGEQYEVGIKWQPEGSKTLLTLAAYHLTQQNVLTADPDQVNHPGGQVQTGEIRSKGIEFEAASELARNLRLRASLTFNSSEVSKSNTAAEVGRRPPDTPARMASLWMDYRLSETALRGLIVGAGMRYVGGTYDTANAVKTSGYTVYDAMLGYEIERWKFTLNLLNVFDKHYLSSCNAYACYYGQPRTAMLTARYAW